MGDDLQPSKKRAAGRELSRDNPGLDDEEEVSEQELGTFKKASEEVLATRRIIKPRRQTTTAPSAAAPSSNPFAGIRLVPPPASAPAPAEAQVVEDKKGSEDADTKDDANSECETKKVEPEEEVNEPAAEHKADKENDDPTEQAPAATNDAADKAAELRPNEEREADGSSEKAFDGESTGEVHNDGETNENEKTDAKDNDDSDASGSGGAALSSFQQLSNSQNAFTGLTGTGFSSSTFSFGSLQKDGSPSQSSLPSFSFGASTNGSTPLFGSVMTGTSIGTKSEGSAFRSMQEVPTETGEENEETVFTADSGLFEFLDGGWKERGKGEVKLNVLKAEAQKARLVMRTKGNLRLILNASLFPDMKLTKMDKKGVTFACVNIATEGKDGLSTFALKFKDGSVMEEFSSAVEAHKGTPATSALKTPENSPKAADD